MRASTSKLVPPTAVSPVRPPRRRTRTATPTTGLPPSRNLIGPPCPLSNLRPVYYAPLFPDLHRSPSRPTTSHPYSLAEFPSSTSSTSSQARLAALKQRLHADDLEWRLHQYRVDAFNQAFWVRTNTHFLKAKEDWVNQHAAQQWAEDQRGEDELDLSPFYKEHLERTKKDYADYNAQLWRLQASLVWPAAKAAVRGWRWRWALWRAGGEGAVA